MRRFLSYPASLAKSLGIQARWRGRLRVEELESRTVLTVLTPAQISHAYGFDQIAFSASGKSVPGDGTGQTIAIVTAYDNPHILSDLQHFDSSFGLPDPNFTKATPQGLPARNSSWSLETSLDVEWAHAVAPKANILLVEAASASLSDLLGAVDYARQQDGVAVVSMSWGGSEFSNEAQLDKYFTTPAGHAGVTFIASAGDSPGAMWPSVSPNVVSVGGTTLKVLDSLGTYGSETAWTSSGGGVSSFEQQPAFQGSAQSSGKRTTPDVAYNANTGVQVFNSTSWYSVGGTSAGAPQWAGLVAIADQGRALAGKGSLNGSSQTLYALYDMAQTTSTPAFHTVNSAGYSLTTGLGTPRANQVVQTLVNVSGSGLSLTLTTPKPTTTTTTTTTGTTSTGTTSTGTTSTGTTSTGTTSTGTMGPVQPKSPGSPSTQTSGVTDSDREDSSQPAKSSNILVVVPINVTILYPPSQNVRINVDPTVTLPPVDQTPATSSSTSLFLSTTQQGSGGGDNPLFGGADSKTDALPIPVQGAPAGQPTPGVQPAPVQPRPDGPSGSQADRRRAIDVYFAAGYPQEEDFGGALAEAAITGVGSALEPGAVVAALALLLPNFWGSKTLTKEEMEKQPVIAKDRR